MIQHRITPKMWSPAQTSPRIPDPPSFRHLRRGWPQIKGYPFPHRPAPPPPGFLSQVFLLPPTQSQGQKPGIVPQNLGTVFFPLHLHAFSITESCELDLGCTPPSCPDPPCPLLLSHPHPQGLPLALPSPVALPPIPCSMNHITRLFNTYQGCFPQVKAPNSRTCC